MTTEKYIDRVAAGDDPSNALDEAISESSLSRLRKHMLEHDTGFITAFRSDLCPPTGTPITKAQNRKRNQQLLAELTKSYNVTKVRGSYIENYGQPNAKEVGEDTFFVVDAKDTGRLERDLRKLGKKYDQDSILFMPRGAESGMLWGTNACAPWPGQGKSVKLGHPVFGKSGEFMTRVRGRPFVLESQIIEERPCDYPLGRMGEMGRRAFIDSDWRDTDD